MACALTGSQLLDCKDSVGGIRTIKIKVHPGSTVLANDFTYTSGTITIATGSRSLWYTYEFEKETSSITTTAQPNPQAGIIWYQQEIKLILNKLSARLYWELDLKGKNRLLIAVRDINDVYHLFGYEFGCDLTAGVASSGTARGDRSGYDLTFTGKEKTITPVMTAATWDTLVT